MTPSSGLLEVGSLLAEHRIEAVVGRGGMGVVYRATDLSLERVVALKLIAPQLCDDEHFRDRFKREARLAASLDHSNVIPVHAAGEHDGQLYVTMRFVEGTDLRRLLAGGALAPERAAAIVAQVASALDAAHHRGLVHRDVKPANILLERDGPGEPPPHAYLTDFGLARLALSGTHMTNTGVVLGTLDYIAPEQLAGDEVDHRTDVYSLACVLYEALTGQVPYPADNQLAKMFAHSSAEPPALADAAPHLPAALHAVIRQGMAKDPAERYSTPGELARAALAATDLPATEPDHDEQPTGLATATPSKPTSRRRVARKPKAGSISRTAVPAAIITTVAGTGTEGLWDDGIPATQTPIDYPSDVAATPDGGFLFTETGVHRVRRVAPDGTITTVAGTGIEGFAGDGGPATHALLGGPRGIAVAPDGAVLIADAFHSRVCRVGPDGVIATIAGRRKRLGRGFACGFSGDGGPATKAELGNPWGVAAARDGGVLIADLTCFGVRRVAPDGTITTVAGCGVPGFDGDGGRASMAALTAAWDVAATPDGGFLIADTYNNRVRRVAPDGTITTVAGSGEEGYGGDGGPATKALLNNPCGVAVMPDGGFVIADSSNHRLRRVAADGTITTLAGSGEEGSGGDDGPASKAQLSGPQGLDVTADGDILIADYGNRRIRRVSVAAVASSPRGAAAGSAKHSDGSAARGSTRDAGQTAPSRAGPSATAAAGDEQFALAEQLDEQGDWAGAEAAYRRAEELGNADGAAGLGALALGRGDLAAAEAAFARGDKRGSADAAIGLASVFIQRGEHDRALAPLRRADERGSADAALGLGGLLQQRGDLHGAEAAYRRADERGDADGAFQLAVILAQRGDPSARAAVMRADQRGSADAAAMMAEALKLDGDRKGARAARRRAKERGWTGWADD